MNSSISSKLKAQSSFKYLGVFLIPKLKYLFQVYYVNYVPPLKKIKEELEHWNLLPISFLWRIIVIKINVMPRISYLSVTALLR